MDKPNVLFEELEKLEHRLWGITGYFSKAEDETVIKPFGGYFFQDTFLGGNITNGQLVDFLGMSSIKGKIIPDIELSFDKIYHGKDYFIHYEFKKVGSLFVGRYKMVGKIQQSQIEGDAKCIILPLTKLPATHDILALLYQ